MNSIIYTIDAGNTNSSTLKWENDDYEVSYDIKSPHEAIILSNVGNKNFPHHFIDLSNIKEIYNYLPMKVNYTNSLGIDRLMCGLSAFIQNKKNKNILIIDAGTFTTIDIIKEDSFEGGLIIPGDKQLISNYECGAKLHSESLEIDKNLLFPYQNTNQCLKSSISFILRSTYKYLLEEHQVESIYLTGGNLQHHKCIIDSIGNENVLIINDPNLIHKGMYYFYQNCFKSMEKKYQ